MYDLSWDCKIVAFHCVAYVQIHVCVEMYQCLFYFVLLMEDVSVGAGPPGSQRS